MNRWRSAVAGLSLALATGCAATEGPESDGPPGRAATGLGSNEPVSVYVVLRGPSAVEVALTRASSAQATGLLAPDRMAVLARQHGVVRSELTALDAQVVADLRRLANAIQVTVPRSRLPRIASLPEVERIDSVSTFRLTLASALPAIGAPSVWSNSTPYTGAGIRMGIIDSGVDYTHADFGGSGDPADYADNDPTTIEEGSFPTARVVGGFDFAGDDYDPSDPEHEVPIEDPDPIDCDPRAIAGDAAGHGTHIAGVAGGGGVLLDGSPFSGPYAQSLDLSTFRVAPGVAPEVQLYALRVFGCSGSTRLVASALEWAADPDGDGDFGDRLDVINASVGAVYGLGSETEAQMVSNLHELGAVVVTAGGNDGATFFTVDAPGTYSSVIAAAASQTPEFLTVQIESPPTIAGAIPAAEGDFTRPLMDTGPLTGTVVSTVPPDGCTSLVNGDEVTSHIALIDRGECSFEVKLAAAAAAGAVAAVVVDDEDQPFPIIMGGSTEVDIPGVFIRRADGDRIEGQLAAGVIVTLQGGEIFEGLGGEIIAEFSSRGPSAADTSLKPDVAAPGFSVDSARVGTGHRGRRANGTSVSTPMVAGAAALLRQARPTWQPTDIKAVLMNTAEPLQDDRGMGFPISMAGAGRVDVARAVASDATLRVAANDGSVGVSFGSLVLGQPQTVQRELRVYNHGGAALSYAAVTNLAYPLPGLSVAVAPQQLTVPAGGSAALTLTLAVDPAELGAPAPDPLTPPQQEDLARHYLNEAAGYVQLYDDFFAIALRVPFYGTVRAAADRSSQVLAKCVATRDNGSILLGLDGPSAHPNPVTSAFELGVLHPVRPGADDDPAIALADVRAVGAATSYGTAQSFADVELAFGIAVGADWTTPARGPYRQIGVIIDTDFDGETDAYVLADPLTRDGPYADVLLAVTYDASSGEVVEPARFVNMASADEIDTQPFHNSVLVLGANAVALGLTEESSQFSYAVFSRSRKADIENESTDWIPFDATRPAVDAAQRATVPGRPLFASGEPMHVVVDGDPRVAESDRQLLLLHHTNSAASRVEIVSLGQLTRDALLLHHWASRTIEAGGPLFTQLTVVNNTDHELSQVRLEGDLTGGGISSVTSSEASCAARGAVSCSFPPLAPGQSADVSIEGRAADTLRGGEAAELSVTMFSPDGCDTTLRVAMAVPIPDGPFRAAGGCDCQLRRSGQPPVVAFGVALLLFAVAGGRRGYAGVGRSRRRTGRARES